MHVPKFLHVDASDPNHITAHRVTKSGELNSNINKKSSNKSPLSQTSFNGSNGATTNDQSSDNSSDHSSSSATTIGKSFPRIDYSKSSRFIMAAETKILNE